MPVNKLNKKWYALIWFVLIAASLIRNAYGLFVGYSSISDPNTGKVLLEILVDVMMSGVLPAALCYLCGSILFTLAWRRGLVFSSRNDFVYIIMIATACARTVIGMIEIFAILEPAVYLATSVLMDEVFLSLAMLLAFFLVLVPKFMNPRVAHRTFNLFSSIYLVFQGLNTLTPCFYTFVLSGNGVTVDDNFIEMIKSLGMQYPVPQIQIYSCAVAVGIFFALIILAIILSQYLRKKAEAYVEPEPAHGAFRGGNNPYNNGNPYNNPYNNGNPYDPYNGRNPYNNGNPYDTYNNQNPYNGANPQNVEDEHPFDELADDGKAKNGDVSGEDNVFDEFDL